MDFVGGRIKKRGKEVASVGRLEAGHRLGKKYIQWKTCALALYSKISWFLLKTLNGSPLYTSIVS
jgi:hypothetical protein